MLDWLLSSVYSRLDIIDAKLNQVLAALLTLQLGDTNMARDLSLLQGRIDSLTQAVANDTSVISSATTLIQGFSATLAAIQQQLADAIANSPDPQQLQQLSDQVAAAQQAIDSKTAELAAAVQANTPQQQPA